MNTELQELLSDLVRQQGGSSPLLQDFARLDVQREALRARVLEPRKRRKSYESARQLLEYLMRSSRFDEELGRLSYPAQLLKGPIDLARAHQQAAVAELAVTLDRDPVVPEPIRKLMRALQLYYSDYFDAAGLPPHADVEAERQLGEFESDPARGGRADYQRYTAYIEALKQADAHSERIAGLAADRPPFAADIHAQFLLTVASPELKRHLLGESEWKATHRAALEAFFAREKDPALLAPCLQAMASRMGGAGETFLDAQLADPARASAVMDHLRTLEEPLLKEWLRRSVRRNWPHLFAALVQLVGLDTGFCYFSLNGAQVDPQIFRRIIDSIYLPRTPQETYGMDAQYAQKVMDRQRGLSDNVLRILQKTMPRGVDLSPLKSFFALVREFNGECQRLLEARRPFEEGTLARGHDHAEIMREFATVEAVRFVAFTYIYDHIEAAVKHGRPLEPAAPDIAAFLLQQGEFERTCAGNRNITVYVEELLGLLTAAPAAAVEG